MGLREELRRELSRLTSVRLYLLLVDLLYSNGRNYASALYVILHVVCFFLLLCLYCRWENVGAELYCQLYVVGWRRGNKKRERRGWGLPPSP